MTATAPGIDEVLLGFTHALRAAGVAVTHDRSTAFLEATALVGAEDLALVHAAGRATLCAGPEDLARFEEVFFAWFAAPEGLPRRVPRQHPRTVTSPFPQNDEGAGAGEDEAEVLQVSASEREVLQHRDVADLGPDEKALLDLLIAGLAPRLPLRRATRRTTWRRGEIDVHRTLRTMLRQLGEPSRIDHRRRGVRPRRIVLLIDVSASMRPYADALLRLTHVITHAGRRASGASAGPVVEAFTLGTRLTRITEALRTRDPDRALVRAGEQIPDWSGGTRLGETLKVFLTRSQTRDVTRGAVVVVFSDGWEHGDGAELGEQLARLRRLAHRVVWVNPHRGKAGYQPVQAGIVAVLPHVDHFLAGHSLRAFEELLEVVADA